MTLYSLPSGTKFPKCACPQGRAALCGKRYSLFHTVQESGRCFVSHKYQKKSGPHTALGGALDNGFVYHGRVPNGHLLELLVEFSLCIPNLTASRTLSTVILGWYAGLVPCWKTPVRTRIEYHVFCALPDSSNSLVPRMSDSGVSPTKYTVSGGWLML
jgi:hypothetical protein